MACRLEEYITELSKNKEINDLLKRLKSIKMEIVPFDYTENSREADAKDKARAEKVKDTIATLPKEDQELFAKISKAPKGSNPEYQNYMLNWLKNTTTAPIHVTEDAFVLSGILENKLQVTMGSYSKDLHTVRIAENVSLEKAKLEVMADIHQKMKDELNPILLEDQINKWNADPEMKEGIEETSKQVIALVNKVKEGHVLTHELIHANAYWFMQNNPEHVATKRINELYQIALDSQEVIDSSIARTDIIGGYWTTNVDEFLAEGLSNPDVMAALMQIKVPGKKKLTVFSEIIDTVLDMLGLKGELKENVYTLLLDGFAKIVEEQANPDVTDNMQRKNAVQTATIHLKDRAKAEKAAVDKLIEEGCPNGM